MYFPLTNRNGYANIIRHQTSAFIWAGIAQPVEQLICNQQVGGSNPSTSSTVKKNMGEFPSGQRGQTVNLLSMTSVVRIHPLPPSKGYKKDIATENLDFIKVFSVFMGEISVFGLSVQ